MALKVNDYECTSCGDVAEQFLYTTETPERCARCGGAVSLIILKAPHTDVYGSEQYDAANEISFTSERDRERKMRELGPGFERSPSADKHHGARNEEHLGLGKLYSYPGQRRRSSGRAMGAGTQLRSRVG